MDEYFSSTLAKLKSHDYADLNLVIGNESCDLDSAVSALVYAIFLNWQYNQIKCKVCTRGLQELPTCKEDIFIPILMVDRIDYPLKTEVAFCLKEHGIRETNLIFSDDLDIKQLISTKKTKVTLVDHHILSDKYNYLIPYVSEIIDHRPRNDVDWKYKEDIRSTIELVGSCSTLVGQRIRDLSMLMAKGNDFFVQYPTCSDLLYNVIILDTVNFSKTLNKATPHDEEMVQYLESVLNLDNVEEQRKLRLDRLVAARADVSSLNASQLLRKDLKTVNGVLVPSFPILVEEFLNRPGALEAVNDALKAKECTIALLLGMDLKNGLKRDGAIYPMSQEGDSLLQHLKAWSNPPLQLEPVSRKNCFYFKQLNLSASRKQYMPALNDNKKK